MSKPLVAISMSHLKDGRDAVRDVYVSAIVESGGIPQPLANVLESVEALGLADGLLLTGGGDVDPALFGAQDQGTHWDGQSDERDRTELALIGEANRLDMPIFGICRGMQMLAVGFGGTLIQDIPRALGDGVLAHDQKEDRDTTTHLVEIDAHSQLYSIVGEQAQLTTNSFHHQAVQRIPDGWRKAAWAPDGVIEGIERPGERFLVGVQWHPEDLVVHQSSHRALFEQFVKACAAYRARKGNYVGTSD